MLTLTEPQWPKFHDAYSGADVRAVKIVRQEHLRMGGKRLHLATGEQVDAERVAGGRALKGHRSGDYVVWRDDAMEFADRDQFERTFKAYPVEPA